MIIGALQLYNTLIINSIKTSWKHLNQMQPLLSWRPKICCFWRILCRRCYPKDYNPEIKPKSIKMDIKTTIQKLSWSSQISSANNNCALFIYWCILLRFERSCAGAVIDGCVFSRLPVRLTELDSVVFVVLMLFGAFYHSANMIFCAGLFVLRFLLLSILHIYGGP